MCNGTMTSTSLLDQSPRIISSLPPCTRRGVCSTWRRWFPDADWLAIRCCVRIGASGNSADNTINTCNGGDCTKFIESNGQNGRVLIDQPALWTENWMGWFDSWGGAPAGDWPSFEATAQSSSKALGIYKWVARGGSHVNFCKRPPMP